MSFFRVLLALLISGGIAYGLYAVVTGKSFDQVVQAVRTEIVDPVRERIAPDEAVEEPVAVAEVEPASGDTVEADAPSADASEVLTVEALDDAAVDAETVAAIEENEADAPAADESEAPTAEAFEGAAVDAETVIAIEDDAADAPAAEAFEGAAVDAETVVAIEEDAEAETRSFVERTEETLANAAEAVVTATETVVEGAVEIVTGSDEETADTATDNSVPRIAAQPVPSETVLPAEGQAPAALETQNALPAARIEESEAIATESTDALTVVVGGMSYMEARETMIDAGWSPRVPDIRAVGPSDAEAALLEAGYEELEGCKDGARPLCRFEFVDGEKRIAAVLTAGTGTDPSVIDAFLMDIRAE